MSSPLRDSDAGIGPLPQCGFGTEINFDKLMQTNHFLFRVYTPKERSPFADDSEPFFVAPRFNELVARSPLDLPEIKFPETMVGTYAEVARHMEWTTKASSCYLSASFNLGWAIWEAVKRYHVGVKKDVEIAVIDTSALGGRAATAVQLLMKSNPKQRDEQFWKWHRFSQDSQTALIYGMVPRQAVLASVPLLQILRKMPSYFLHKDIQVIDGNPLDLVAWNYASRKFSYRHFCQEMSSTFKNRPEEIRLRDATGGAVRMALSFLRPFFHRVIQEDFDTAISYLRTLALSISQWPGDGFVNNHPEVRQIVDSMVLALGEELREKYTLQRMGEVSQLQKVIHDLEASIEAGKIRLRDIDEADVFSDGDLELELEESDDPTLVSTEPRVKDDSVVERNSSLRLLIHTLPIPASFQTPITPPESPRHSLTFPAAIGPHGKIASTELTLKPPSLSADSVEETEETPVTPKTALTSPVSPPLTPPPRSPVFTVPPPLVQDIIGTIQEEDEEALQDDVVAQLEHEVESTLENDVLGRLPVVRAAGPYDDDERTEQGDDESESLSWVHLSTPSPSLSRRSSVFSVDTLIDPIEMSWPKRWSFSHSRTNSYNVYLPLSPPFSPPSSVHSRTVSFSEPVKVPFLLPVNPCSIPLPPSPTTSERPLTPPFMRPETPIATSSSSTTLDSAFSLVSTPSTPLTTPPTEPTCAPPTSIVIPNRYVSLLHPLDDNDEETTPVQLRSQSGIAATASYVVSGFLVGTFITFFLFSTQRRTMLYVT